MTLRAGLWDKVGTRIYGKTNHILLLFVVLIFAIAPWTKQKIRPFQNQLDDVWTIYSLHKMYANILFLYSLCFLADQLYYIVSTYMPHGSLPKYCSF
jgi:hypothetical protein